MRTVLFVTMLFWLPLQAAMADVSGLKTAGQEAYASGRYADAAHLLTRYCRICVGDWTGWMALCQADEAAGRHHEAQVAATRLQRLWASGNDPRLSALDRFVRERSGDVCVYERFSTTPSWDIAVTSPEGRPQRLYSVHGATVTLTDFEDPRRDTKWRLPQPVADYRDVRAQVVRIYGTASVLPQQ